MAIHFATVPPRIEKAGIAGAHGGSSRECCAAARGLARGSFLAMMPALFLAVAMPPRGGHRVLHRQACARHRPRAAVGPDDGTGLLSGALGRMDGRTVYMLLK